MPKLFGRTIHPMVMGVVGIVGVYAFYTVLFPGDAATTTSRRPKAAAKKTTGETDYLLSDYTFKIDPLPESAAPKDAFKPLVIKSNQMSNGTLTVDNFTYSGMATINDKAQGLLENSQTGQGDFVEKGQKWHDSWLVVSISPEQIELRNDGGDITTLVAGAASQKAAAASSAATANNTPVSIVGAIGGPDLTVQPDPTQMGGPGGGNNNRRGRRNRGGGGGGYNPNGG